MYLWEDNYSALKEYYYEYGTTRIKEHIKYRGYSLGSFVRKCRTDYNAGKLSEERISLLMEIDFIFDPYSEDWNEAFKIANDYYVENGHLLVAQRDVYKNFRLGQWISNQRNAYKNKSRKFTDERKKKLDEIGMVWNANEASWEMYYLCAKQYYEKYGNLDVLVKYEVDGIKLGRWISNQRTARRYPEDSHTITDEKIKRLDEIGMIWEYSNTKQASFPEKAMFFYFKQIFPNAIANDRSFGCEMDAYDAKSKIGMEYDGAFYHKNPEKDMANNKILCRNVKLYRFREKGCPELSDGLSTNIQLERNDNFTYFSEVLKETFDTICKEIGSSLIDVDICRDLEDILKLFKSDTDKFEFWFKKAQNYYLNHGNLLIEITDEESKGLYNFISRCRAAYAGRKGKITKDQIKKLESLHMVWNVPEDQFENNMTIAKRYIDKYGSLEHIPENTIFEGMNINNFIYVLRRAYKADRLSDVIIAQLEAMGMVWTPHIDQWSKYYALLKKIYNRDGNIDIPFTYEEEGLKIGRWLYHQILAYWKVGNRYIDEDRIKLLNKLHIDWKAEFYGDGIAAVKEKRWIHKYDLVLEYIDCYGEESLDTRTCYKGEKIGAWISKQRMSSNLSPEKIDMLRKLGIKLDVFEEEWLEMFLLVKEYVECYGWDALHEKTRYRGKPIGRWIDTRRQEKKGKRGVEGTLTREKIEMLNSIGMVWDIYLDKWKKYYDSLVDWLRLNDWKDLSVNVNHWDLDIGRWVIRQRRIKNGTAKTGKLSDEQIQLLEKIGIEWNALEAKWDYMFSLVAEYTNLNGWNSLKSKTEYKKERIGAWTERQRGAYWGKCGRLKISRERIKRLEEIGMKW